MEAATALHPEEARAVAGVDFRCVHPDILLEKPSHPKFLSVLNNVLDQAMHLDHDVAALAKCDFDLEALGFAIRF